VTTGRGGGRRRLIRPRRRFCDRGVGGAGGTGRAFRRISQPVHRTGRRCPVTGAGRRWCVQRRLPVDGRVLDAVLQPPEVRGDGEHGRRLGRQERQAARDERPAVPVIVVGPQSTVEPVAVAAVH